MRFEVLGPIRVRAADRDLGTGSGRERLVLTVMLLDAARMITVDRLIDVLWDTDPPLRLTPGGPDKPKISIRGTG